MASNEVFDHSLFTQPHRPRNFSTPSQRPRNFSIPSRPIQPPSSPVMTFDQTDVEEPQSPQYPRFYNDGNCQPPVDEHNRYVRPSTGVQRSEPLDQPERPESKGRSRRPSFRQTISLTSPRPSVSSFSRPSMSNFSRPNIKVFPQRSSWSYSKRSSKQPAPSAVPPAPQLPSQYYQDPDARMKLKVYLGSPQKFEEVLAYGFPSSPAVDEQRHKQKLSATGPGRADSDAQLFLKDDALTFLDDTPDEFDNNDDNEALDDEDDTASIPSRDSPITPSDNSFHHRTRRSTNVSRPSTTISRDPGNHSRVSSQVTRPYRLDNSSQREMTLRMTLTKPELRAGEEQIYRWQNKQPGEDLPLAVQDSPSMAEFLPQPAVEALPQLDIPPVQEGGTVRRFLRKMKSQTNKR